MNRLQALAPLLLLSLCIAVAISGVITYLNIGWSDQFVSHWWRAALLGWCVMMPVGGTVVAGASRIVNRRLADRPQWLRRLLASLLIGLTMEALASAIATGSNVGLGPGFLGHWLSAYVRAIPFGVLIGLVMGFVVGPWMGRRAARLAVSAAPSPQR